MRLCELCDLSGEHPIQIFIAASECMQLAQPADAPGLAGDNK
jgi:hypothetical protein